MIVTLTGNVNFTITLDPSVWIFDDRKILLEEAFTEKKEINEEDALKAAAQRWDDTVQAYPPSRMKPPVNKSLSKHEREQVLENSYVMPISDFLNHAEIKDDAKDVTLVTKKIQVNITVDQREESYRLFSINGKPL